MSGYEMEFSSGEGDMTDFRDILNMSEVLFNDDSWMNEFTTLNSEIEQTTVSSGTENIDPALLGSRNEQSRSPPSDRALVAQNGTGEIVNGELVLDPQLRGQEQCGLPMQDGGMLQEYHDGGLRGSPGSQAPDFDSGAQGGDFHAPNANLGYAPQAKMTPTTQYHRPGSRQLPFGNYAIGFTRYPPRYQSSSSAQTSSTESNSPTGNAVYQASSSPNLHRTIIHRSIEDETQQIDLNRSDLASNAISASQGGRPDLQNGSIDPRCGQGQQIGYAAYDNIPRGMGSQAAGSQMPEGPYFSGGMDEPLYDPQSYNNDLWGMNMNDTFSIPLPTNIVEPSTSFSPTPTTHQPTPALPITRPTNFRTPTLSLDSKEKGTCIHINEKTGKPCGKNFFLSKSDCSNRCQRCCNKFLRKTASGPFFTLSADIPTLTEARNLIHPPMHRNDEYIALGQEEAQRAKEREDEYIQKFLNAINDSQTSQATPWLAKQQATFSGNCALKPSYSPAMITARLRALFAELIFFHSPNDPAQQHFYAVGGDNTGYAVKFDLGFEERVRIMCEQLALNKRIVMDVVEGRGVQGFVGHPEDFARRKRSNMDCNEKKNGIYERGKRVQKGEEGRGRGKRKGGGDGDEGEGEDEGDVGGSEDDDGDVPSPPPPKRTRRAKGKQSPDEDGEDKEFQPSSPFPQDQVYGSGRANTVSWINGRSRRRRS